VAGTKGQDLFHCNNELEDTSYSVSDQSTLMPLPTDYTEVLLPIFEGAAKTRLLSSSRSPTPSLAGEALLTSPQGMSVSVI
jgi:hypothetical protein